MIPAAISSLTESAQIEGKLKTSIAGCALASPAALGFSAAFHG